MANELDELMLRIEENPLGATDKDIDAIIEYQRKARAIREGGGKVKRAKGESGAQGKITLEQLGLKKPSVVSKPTVGGLRRL